MTYKYLRPEEVGDLLGVSVRTLMRWRQQTRDTGEAVGPIFVNLNGNGPCRYPDELLGHWQSDQFDKAFR